MFTRTISGVSAVLFWVALTGCWSPAKADACDDASQANIAQFKTKLDAIPDTAEDGRCQLAVAALDFWSKQQSSFERLQGSCATPPKCDAKCLQTNLEGNRTAIASYCGPASACFDGKMIFVEGTVVRVFREKDLWRVILGDLRDDRPGAVKACGFRYYIAPPKNMPANAIILQSYEKPSCQVGSRGTITIKASKDPVLPNFMAIESEQALACR